MAMPPCFRQADLQKFYLSPLLSDVTIICDNRRMPAHKLILAMASEFFRSAFTGTFIESKSQVLVLYDDDSDTIADMLKYIYGLDPFEEKSAPLDIYHDLELFAVAGKYQLDGLLSDAVKSAKEKVETLLRYGSFPDLLRIIYEETPSHGGQIRDIFKEICREHLPDLMQKKEFKEIILELPELALDIIDVVSREEQ
ncbi:Putative BTB/POZ domain-containing protein [Septoria linicola]|uniref:BTB/POZ domain-containing protein n=1 Tax=Septoria linicola TaxID=215465 RepID=A0A9Q9AQI5_9PEZI|nr:putative BTB/POZ domain-containing protein [Septoria linicola]USW52644.1 Putative BTB/POZ domain-containing protein [Septoria linicola]